MQSNRNTKNITVYSDGGASVVDVVDFDLSKGNQTQVIVTGISDKIEENTLFVSKVKDVFPISSELVNSNQLFKYLKDSVITITDTSPYNTDQRIYTGTLKSFNGSVITLSENNTSTLLRLPSFYAISIEQEITQDIINPYMIIDINKGNGKGKQTLQVSYETNGVFYEMSYKFLLKKNKNMQMIIKSLLKNSTSSYFKNATITLEETALKEEPRQKNMLYKEHSRSLKKTVVMAAPNNVGSYTTLTAQESTKKVFPIANKITLLPNSEKHVNMFYEENIPFQLQYIYKPQQNNSIEMNLVWSKTDTSMDIAKKNKTNATMALPVGEASIWKETEDGITKLGKSRITVEQSTKRNIRLDLGFATAITAKFTKIGTLTAKRESTYRTNYEIEFNSSTETPITIIVQQLFEKEKWNVEGDLQFTTVKPDNEGEYVSKQMGQASVLIPAGSQTILKYTVIYDL